MIDSVELKLLAWNLHMELSETQGEATTKTSKTQQLNSMMTEEKESECQRQIVETNNQKQKI